MGTMENFIPFLRDTTNYFIWIVDAVVKRKYGADF